MHTTRRGEPLPINQALNRPRAKLGLDLSTWMRHENSSGANVYLGVNPLHPGSRKRTKDSIANVRHLYLDIDVNGEERLAALRASETVPTPNAIISTSPDKYQVLWRVEGFGFDRQEPV